MTDQSIALTGKGRGQMAVPDSKKVLLAVTVEPSKRPVKGLNPILDSTLVAEASAGVAGTGSGLRGVNEPGSKAGL